MPLRDKSGFGERVPRELIDADFEIAFSLMEMATTAHFFTTCHFAVFMEMALTVHVCIICYFPLFMSSSMILNQPHMMWNGTVYFSQKSTLTIHATLSSGHQ